LRFLLLLVLALQICADDCLSAQIQKYHLNQNNGLFNFILLNYSEIFSDLVYKNIQNSKLESLLTQLNLKNDDTTLNNLIDLVNKYPNPYDFAVAITKDKI